MVKKKVRQVLINSNGESISKKTKVFLMKKNVIHIFIFMAEFRLVFDGMKYIYFFFFISGTTPSWQGRGKQANI